MSDNNDLLANKAADADGGCEPRSPASANVDALGGGTYLDNDDDPLRDVAIHAGAFARVQQGKIGDKYKGLTTMGNGAFGTVLAIEARKSPGVKYACKIINKHEVDKKVILALQQEINLLRSCDHPNIMKFYSFYEDAKQVFLVCELCEGGELFEYVTSKNFLAAANRAGREQNAAIIIRQLLSGVAYLHQLNIVHRDLKPENVLLKSKDDIHDLRIIDFGLGTFWAGEKLTEQVGTPYYIAPEVLKKRYGPPCDVWSLGVILYILIAGEAPFWGTDDRQILDRVRERKYSMSGQVWQSTSAHVRDLITKMLRYPPEERITAQEALQHPWFKHLQEQSSVPASPEDTKDLEAAWKNLGKFRGHQKLQHAVRLCISYHANKDQHTERLIKIFRELDTDGNNVLDKDEFRRAYYRLTGQTGTLTEDVLEAKAEELFSRVDANDDGLVEISEWLAVSLDDEYMLNHGRLQEAFNAFDTDGSGSISVDEILDLMNLDPGERDSVMALVAKYDTDGDGELNFEEFAKMVEGMHDK